MTESGDTAIGETENDIRWRTNILLEIERKNWEGAELLLLQRRAQAAETFHRMNEERQFLHGAWRLKLQRLEDQDYIELNREMERATFEVVKGPITGMEFAGLRKFLSTSQDILVKVTAALLFAAAAAVIHHIVAAQIDRAFDTWFRQYIALVVFILAYRTIDKILEGVLEKPVTALRKWNLRAEALHAYFDTIKARRCESVFARVRASLAESK